MCPPECRNVAIHVDVFGRAHRPSPTVLFLLHRHINRDLYLNLPFAPTVNTLPAENHFFAFKSQPFSDGLPYSEHHFSDNHFN